MWRQAGVAWLLPYVESCSEKSVWMTGTEPVATRVTGYSRVKAEVKCARFTCTNMD